MIDISVVVPVYNVESYLKKCLDSILAQTHRNFELILINDGSPDNCGIICEEYREKDSRIKVIHQKNQGVGMARNNGLDIAKGKYIYFCDPDDYLEKNLFADNLKLAEEHSANMLIFGIYEKVYDKLIPITYESKFLKSNLEFRNEFPELFKEHNMHVLWNKLYKKDSIDINNIRFSTKKIGEDSSFNKQIYINLDKVYINEDIYYYHINRQGSAQNVYQEDRFDMRYSETSELEQLVKAWGYYDKYKQLILKDWLKTLFVGIVNLFHNESPDNDKVKKQKIRSMILNPKIKHSIEEVSLKNVDGLFSKIITFFLKNRFFQLMFFAFKIRKIVKKD
ncbi:glycosyltransferase family 2 protein [Peribacillus simplex]|uniref:glycosyltransferase family 2 protein n=2 Tax=Peribacillus simplex TaxID=1478 RepID=UPI00366AFFBF